MDLQKAGGCQFYVQIIRILWFCWWFNLLMQFMSIKNNTTIT